MAELTIQVLGYGQRECWVCCSGGYAHCRHHNPAPVPPPQWSPPEDSRIAEQMKGEQA